LSVRQATAALTTWARQMTADRPEAEQAIGANLRSQATALPFDTEAVLFFSPILAAFGLVLLIACANVASMMLARAMARQREIGIRLSLGAARSRLIRQLLTESVLLALPAAAAGFALSQATIQYGQRLMFATMPAELVEFITVIALPPDVRVFGFMLAAALGSAVLFGLAPAIQAMRPNVMQAARGDFSSDFRPARLRNALVAGQITMCALLLICAGVLLRGARRLANFEVGLKTAGMVEMEIQDKFRARILARLAAEPVVQTVVAAQSPPLDGALPTVPVVAGDSASAVGAWYNFVSPEYFPALEIPILRGRNFTRDEAAAGAPVAVISLATAHLFWPSREAVGQSIHMVRDPQDHTQSRVQRHESVRVIGIARDIVSCCAILGVDKTCIYLPTTPAENGDALLVRVHGDAEVARRKLDAEIAQINPGAIDQIHRMDQMRAAGVYPFQAASWICACVGALALLLTLSGIYGVLSYLVTQRTKEIGIRVALGASTGSVTFLVLRQSMRLAGFGIAIGSVMALGVSRLFAAHLVGINMFDGLAYGGGVLLVIAASAAAAYFPSRRAARIDPTTTLRYD
jgi:predicted permease